MRTEGQGARGKGQRCTSCRAAACGCCRSSGRGRWRCISAITFRAFAGDNYSFLWNLWWMRKALSAPELDFFQLELSVQPVRRRPHQSSAHGAAGLHLGDRAGRAVGHRGGESLHRRFGVPERRVRVRAGVRHRARSPRSRCSRGVAFGGSPYVAAHLLGHFDLLTAWVHAAVRAVSAARAADAAASPPAIGCGLCVAIAAYAAYYHVVYLALFALDLHAGVVAGHSRWLASRAPQTQRLFTARLIIMALMALDVFLIAVIAMSGGDVVRHRGR